MAVASAQNQPEITLKLKINKPNHKANIITATDVESFIIEGVAMGPEKVTQALANVTERAHAVTHHTA